MTFGFAPPPATDSVSRQGRMLEPAEWADAGIPLLRDPREVVEGLYARHLLRPSTAVVAVYGPSERLVASASFTQRTDPPDGWQFRNGLLAQLRRVLPHDLRRRSPVRTAVLLYCRDGERRWTEVDGAWMWGLRDACTLHGLRCGAYVMLTPDGWQVLGEGRGGRRPRVTGHTDLPRPRVEPDSAREPPARGVSAPESAPSRGTSPRSGSAAGEAPTARAWPPAR